MGNYPSKWRRDPLGDDPETIYTEEPFPLNPPRYPYANVLAESAHRSRRRRINWLNVISLVVLVAALVACLHEAGCIGR